jgi:hypothetical protein
MKIINAPPVNYCITHGQLVLASAHRDGFPNAALFPSIVRTDMAYFPTCTGTLLGTILCTLRWLKLAVCVCVYTFHYFWADVAHYRSVVALSLFIFSSFRRCRIFLLSRSLSATIEMQRRSGGFFFNLVCVLAITPHTHVSSTVLRVKKLFPLSAGLGNGMVLPSSSSRAFGADHFPNYSLFRKSDGACVERQHDSRLG